MAFPQHNSLGRKLFIFFLFLDNPCFKKILENPAPSILIQGAVNPISIGTPVPDCDADGFYKPKQCADDKCWCVNQHGSEIQETKGNHYAVSC